MLYALEDSLSMGSKFLFTKVEQVYHKTLSIRAERSEPVGECSRSAGLNSCREERKDRKEKKNKLLRALGGLRG